MLQNSWVDPSVSSEWKGHAELEHVGDGGKTN